VCGAGNVPVGSVWGDCYEDVPGKRLPRGFVVPWGGFMENLAQSLRCGAAGTDEAPLGSEAGRDMNGAHPYPGEGNTPQN